MEMAEIPVTSPRTDVSRGPAVDRQGTPVIDPTQNVMNLVTAAIQRQDDLRTMESAHIREMMMMRERYELQLSRQEAARIDAIRAVDIAAVSRAAEVSAVQASTLASQVATAAEAMRNQVAAAAAAAASALATALEPIQKSIDDLRKAQYEQQGQKFAQSEGRESKADTQSNIMAVIAVAVSLFIGIAGIGLALFNSLK
jgi:hypothetical protein